MGCDGGTIPRRDELVRLKKKPEQIDKHMERMAKWLHCSITQERLREPTMACELGRLYNKESVLEFLLDKSTSDSAQHIRSLKDVKELKLTLNPEFDKNLAEKKGGEYHDSDIAQYICPVTGLQMNGHYKFCFLWGCGCVLSEKALKEVKSEVCHKCGSAYRADDAVILNGTPEEVNELQDKMEEKRARAKAEKKAKKAQKRKIVTTCTSEDQASTSKEIKTDNETLTNGQPASSKLTNGTAASSKLTNGTAAPSKQPNGVPGASKPKAGSSGKLANGSGGTSKSANGGADKHFDHTKSAVYKSLFLPKGVKNGGHEAHWVTYNPYYAMSK